MRGGSLDRVERAVEHHAGRCRDPPARARGLEIRVDRLDPHLRVEGPDHELADGDCAALREERPDTQIRVHPRDLGGVDRPVWQGPDLAIVDALADEAALDRFPLHLRGLDGRAPDQAEIARDLVGQHLLKPQPEQVRRVTAVRPGEHVAAKPRRSPRTSVAAGAAVRQAGTQGAIHVEITDSVLRARSQALLHRELSLEQLAPPADRAKGVALDEIQRRSGCHDVAAPRSFLFPKRFVDPLPGVVRGLRLVGELGLGHDSAEQQQDRQRRGQRHE